ncbi:DUF885 domain-containing protein [Microbulbifer epialgicus]|uniref:DUF885 family protein n=1 Tax=Microbulbifer epialgicus TaxID=393907 RepID=A0ABV4P4E2_9GAMM
MKLKITLIAAAINSLVIAGCDNGANNTNGQKVAAPAESNISQATVTNSNEVSLEAIKRTNQLFEEFFQENLERTPELKTRLGKKEDYDQWNDLSPEFAKETQKIKKRQLAELNKIDSSTLDDTTRLNLRLAKRDWQQDINNYKWRHHGYPLNQVFATHTNAASLLISMHRIDSVSDAEAYIARLNRIPKYFTQVEENLKASAKIGTIVPKFVLPYLISDSQNLINGIPFNGKKDSPLFADFKSKVEKLEITEKQRKTLIEKSSIALKESVEPAYKKLISFLQDLEKKSTSDDGVWKLADGENFYKSLLSFYTSTNLSADEIHQIGLSEIERIHSEMRKITHEVNFKGGLREFFEFIRTDKQFYYPTTKEGKAEYLKRASAIIENMNGRLDELFITKPKAELDVRAVEPFREKSTTIAFYQNAAPDGSRPGIYYSNLYNMNDMPIYQIEALAYHEGIPGHHMQTSIAQEIPGIPKFRAHGHYTAYTEGWGLYSELVPKEMGLYEDPYSDFGRLTMELWRAGRLVVDTGIHAKKWTREQAIKYLEENTPHPKGNIVKEVERYIVLPGQATAYKIGMLKILELREKAKSELGDQFDLRVFHDTILANGPVSLDVLESLVEDWIVSERAKAK